MKRHIKSAIRNPQSAVGRAFTLIELLVVITIIAILAAMLLPALARAKTKSQQIQCLSNHKQLTLAWLVYVDDSGEKLPFTAGQEGAWYPGMQDFNGANPTNWDINVSMAKSPLWPYTGKAQGVFQCPSEQSYVVPTFGPYQGQHVRRLRSMAMSVWMGGIDGLVNFGPGLNEQTWRVYHKLSDMNGRPPGPSGLIAFSDQREDENSWPNLFIDMTGYPNSPALTQFTGDLVPFYHGGATSYSFADGHSEPKRWKDPRTLVPELKSQFRSDPPSIPFPNDPDIVWLQDHATRAK
jgi:prepilin-type N-terminal cleavage/methylation domain-containing protein/prepilin-type processing-associated H-X9-DG protein